MNISKVAVVGAGTMGSSIVTALIGAGYEVLLKDINQNFLNSGLDRIEKYQASKVKKGLSEEKAREERARVNTTLEYGAFSSVDLVIEAASEDINIKSAVFKDLEKACRPEAILASNTSSLSISQIGAQISSAQRVIGLHFFNPAHLMKLVEVIPGLQTSPNTVATSLAFVQSLGKLGVRVEECASFLVNRLLGRYMNESLYCLQEGSSIEEIDEAACTFNMPIGPLALRDMNGADIGLSVANYNFNEYGERFRPPQILDLMVSRNMLGQKTGRGFYLYDENTKKRTQPNPDVTELIKTFMQPGTPQPFNAQRLFMPMINEAFFALQEKICDPNDLDPALQAGLGMRKGPLALAEDMRLAACLAEMQRLFERYGERFRPAPLLKRYVWGGRHSVVQ